MDGEREGTLLRLFALDEIKKDERKTFYRYSLTNQEMMHLGDCFVIKDIAGNNDIDFDKISLL